MFITSKKHPFKLNPNKNSNMPSMARTYFQSKREEISDILRIRVCKPQEKEPFQTRSIPTTRSYGCCLKNAKSDFLTRLKIPLWSGSNATLRDFSLGTRIGEGAFGKVTLAQKRGSKVFSALKSINKADLLESSSEEDIHNEAKLLSALDFPFIVCLEEYFSDANYLHLVLEYCPGGDLRNHNHNHLCNQETGNQRGLPIEQIRFYGAQLILTLEYLRAVNVIHRDIKPENILLDGRGYIKLTDFGFAKQLQGPCREKIGTPWYTAPEVYLEQEYDNSVDWWAFGVLLFELSTGYLPFDGCSLDEIKFSVIEGILNFPEDFNKDLQMLIEKLLEVDVSLRYGSLDKAAGAGDIKQDIFFSCINFESLFQRVLAPPCTNPLLYCDDQLKKNYWSGA